MFQFFENKIDQHLTNGDQHVPDMKFLPNIKLESEFDAYYPVSIDLSSFKMSSLQNTNYTSMMQSININNNINNNNNNNINNMSSFQIPFGSSDGECSPKSIDENEIGNIFSENNLCSRNNTITQAPRGSKKRNRKPKGNGMCGKSRARIPSDCSIPREKDRSRLFNEAFDGLRKRIPSIPVNKKLSKIEILRLAICYMSYLKFLTEDPQKMAACISEDPDMSSGSEEMAEESSGTKSTVTDASSQNSSYSDITEESKEEVTDCISPTSSVASI